MLSVRSLLLRTVGFQTTTVSTNHFAHNRKILQNTILPLPFTASFTPVRYYARRTARKTTTAVEEETQSSYTTGVQTSQTTATQKRQQDEEYDETTEGALTSDVRKHLVKVYGLLTAGLGIAAMGTLVSAMMPPAILMSASMVGSIGALIGVIGLVFTDRSKTVFRQNLFLGVAGLLGLGIAPLVASSAPGVILAAALGTSAIFGGFTLAAFKARRKMMLMLGGVLGGGLLLVFTCGVAALVLPILGVTNPAILGALYNVNLYLGLGVFSLYIAYDTQNMIESYIGGDTDHVSPALNLFLDIINIFTRLLQIFGRK